MGKTSTAIMFCVPTRGITTTQWAQAFRHLQTPLGFSGMELILHDDPQFPTGVGKNDIAMKRNMGALAAIEQGVAGIMFIGDDTVPPPDAFLRMWKLHNEMQGVDMITGIYYSKGTPSLPLIWKDDPYLHGPFMHWHMGDVFQIDWSGCDCLYVPTYVFERMPQPWFSRHYHFSDGQKGPAPMATEDLYFFNRAKKAGFTLFADTNIQCVHIDRSHPQLLGYGLRPEYPQAQPRVPIPERDDTKTMADIACGYDYPYYEGKIIRFDIDPETKPDVLCDIRSIPPMWYGKFDVVHAAHVLEHMRICEVGETLDEWIKLLKVGGELRLRLPDMGQAAKAITEGKASMHTIQQLFGNQQGRWQTHHSGFTTGIIEKTLNEIPNLKDVKVWVSADPAQSMDGLDICASAIKTSERVPPIMDPLHVEGEEVAVEKPGEAVRAGVCAAGGQPDEQGAVAVGASPQGDSVQAPGGGDRVEPCVPTGPAPGANISDDGAEVPVVGHA